MSVIFQSLLPGGINALSWRQSSYIAFLYAFLISIISSSIVVTANEYPRSAAPSALILRATSTSSSKAATSTTFNPRAAGIPASYKNCIVDPTNHPGAPLSLLSLNDGFTLNTKNGLAGVNTPKTNKSISYTPIGSRSPYSWAYDLVSSDDASSVLAVFKNGSVGFVGNSSFGQNYTTDKAGNSYVTTIFGLTCGGEVVAGFANGPQLFFTQKNGYVYASQNISQPSSERGVVGKAFRMLVYIAAGSPLPYDDPRCPKDDEKSVVKKNARPPGANGCGSESFKVPDLVFLDCCNAHDYCYDDCSADFTTCNENFRKCNLASCASNYPKKSQILERIGCDNLANAYADAVSSPLGEHVWETDDRCECKCKDDSKTLCSGDCVDLQTDSQNCGACGRACPSGVSCVKGSCGGRTNQCPNRKKMPECVASCGAVTSGCYDGYYTGGQLCNTVTDYGNCVCRATMTGGTACVYTTFDYPCGYNYGGSGPYNGTGCYTDDDCDCYSKCIRSDNCCGIGICAYGAGCTPQTEQACLSKKAFKVPTAF